LWEAGPRDERGLIVSVSSSHDPSAVDTFLRGPHSDEHVPPEVEEPLTWLDDLGLGEKLEALAERLRAYYEAEFEESHSTDTIRLALLAWLGSSVSDLLDNACISPLNFGPGFRHFYATLERLTGRAAGPPAGDTPPPPNTPGDRAGDSVF
jgi:hypothetical protein